MMIWKRLMMIGMLAVCLPLAMAQMPRANQTPEWYRNAWREREQQGRTPEKRAALARDLYEAAKATRDQDHKLVLAHKAFVWGQRDLDGYVSAADALNLIQQTDPAQRIWCLEQMAGLYETAYRSRPTKLRLGSGWGETLLELAHQRREDATDQFEDGLSSTGEAIQQLRLVQGDLQRAYSALMQPIRRAESDAAKVKAVGHPELAGSLENFAAEFRAKLDDINKIRDDIGRQQQTLMQLQGAENRYKIRPSAATAEPLAKLYITQFDKPERITEAMAKDLSQPLATNAALACRAPGDLSADQATTLAKWYMGLIADASGDDAKLDMATRAAVYARRAQYTGAADGQDLLNQAFAAAEPLGSEHGFFDGRVRDLSAKLNWMFKKPANTTVAVETTQPHPAVEHDGATTTTHEHDDTNMTPTESVEPTTTSTGSTSTSTSIGGTNASVRGGRPMTICAKCGREFFAGWGDAHETLCPRCRSGRKNIFDFGNDSD